MPFTYTLYPIVPHTLHMPASNIEYPESRVQYLSNQYPESGIKHALTGNKSIDIENTLAYVPPKFQSVLIAPVAQPG
jgi:hypothetical protein